MYAPVDNVSGNDALLEVVASSSYNICLWSVPGDCNYQEPNLTLKYILNTRRTRRMAFFYERAYCGYSNTDPSISTIFVESTGKQEPRERKTLKQLNACWANTKPAMS